MATSSIHIEAGASGYFAHNSRESKTVNSIFDDEKNFVPVQMHKHLKLTKMN